ATSVRVRDLTSTEVEICGLCGVQVISFMARRYRSVAKKVMVSPSISILIAVKIGKVSSLEAAAATCEIASENTAPSMVPATSGIAGKAVYSSTGMVAKVNVEF